MIAAPASFLVLLATLAAGAAVALQAGANAALARSLGHPLWATLASLAVSALLGMALLAVLRVPAPDLGAAWRGAWWTWAGGIAGVFYITVAVLLAPRLGSGAFMATVVGGQMLAALLIDRYGLVGFAIREISTARWMGAALIALGVIVMQGSSAADAVG